MGMGLSAVLGCPQLLTIISATGVVEVEGLMA